MVRTIFVNVVVAALLCSLYACSNQIDRIAVDPHTLTVDAKQILDEEIDYSAFCGYYSDTETVEGPCYTVSIIGVDNENKSIEIMISYVGINSSPLYETEPIHAFIASDHTVQFDWVDSWENRGNGTLVLNPDDLTTVQIMMTVTEEAEVNRTTLSTNDQYIILKRR